MSSWRRLYAADDGPNESFSGKGMRGTSVVSAVLLRAKRRLLTLLLPIAHDDDAGFIDAERFALLLQMDADALSPAASAHCDADYARRGFMRIRARRSIASFFSMAARSNGADRTHAAPIV